MSKCVWKLVLALVFKHHYNRLDFCLLAHKAYNIKPWPFIHRHVWQTSFYAVMAWRKPQISGRWQHKGRLAGRGLQKDRGGVQAERKTWKRDQVPSHLHREMGIAPNSGANAPTSVIKALGCALEHGTLLTAEEGWVCTEKGSSLTGFFTLPRTHRSSTTKWHSKSTVRSKRTKWPLV